MFLVPGRAEIDVARRRRSLRSNAPQRSHSESLRNADAEAEDFALETTNVFGAQIRRLNFFRLQRAWVLLLSATSRNHDKFANMC